MKRIEFNELIEKAFSMGYKYALEKQFSKKVSTSDKASIWISKNFRTSKGRKSSIEDLEDKKSIKKEMIKSGLKGAAIGATSSVVGSVILGNTDKETLIKNAKKGAIRNGIGFATIEGITRGIRRIRKNNPKYAARLKKDVDKLKVADGQMSMEEFGEKWGK